MDGKRRDIGLGSTDMLTLAEAREKLAQGRKWAKLGLDPAFKWRKARAVIPTFEVVARPLVIVFGKKRAPQPPQAMLCRFIDMRDQTAMFRQVLGSARAEGTDPIE